MLIPCILGFLSYQPMTGYEIKGYMENSTKHFMFASFGSIYPALRKLEKLNLITSKQEVDGGRLKVIYSITEDGKTEFSKWISGDWNFDNGMPEMLLRIFFGEVLTKEEFKIKIKEMLSSLENKQMALLALENNIPAVHKHTFQFKTLLYGKDFYEFTKNWLIENTEDL